MWVLIGRFTSYFAVVYVTGFLYGFVAVTNQYQVPVLILLFHYMYFILYEICTVCFVIVNLVCITACMFFFCIILRCFT